MAAGPGSAVHVMGERARVAWLNLPRGLIPRNGEGSEHRCYAAPAPLLRGTRADTAKASTTDGPVAGLRLAVILPGRRPGS